MPRPSPYPEETVPLIARDYKSGKSTHELAAIYGGSRFTIRRRLEAMGVTMRTREERQHRSPCRDEAFAGAETDDEAAYWTGMMMSDGCISDTQHSTWIILTLGERDAEHVEKFRTFMGSPNKITEVPPTPTLTCPTRGAGRSCRVASKKMAADLARYGVVPRKSKIAEVKRLEANRHFWRGVIDGDGSLGRSKGKKSTHADKPILQLVGSEMLMRQFQVFARNLTGTRAGVRQTHSCWGFSLFSGAAIEMISHLYTDCTIALSRKWALAHELMCEWELRHLAHSTSGHRLNRKAIATAESTSAS